MAEKKKGAEIKSAKLYCITPPDEGQKAGIADFLQRTFGTRPEIEVIIDKSVIGGFRLEYGDNVYDWSAQGGRKSVV